MKRLLLVVLAVHLMMLSALTGHAEQVNAARSAENVPGSQHDLDALLSRMTVREKVGQLNYIRVADPNIEQLVRDGDVGGLPNVRDHALRARLERIAAEESRMKIPLIHGADVIHGYRTIFPIPLGQAASWNPELCEELSRVAAIEATAGGGIRWVFAPMVDVSRDPRWGRIAEGYGEDPYLTSVLGAATVRGFQGQRLDDPTSVAACPKHYAGYGASEGGRDYNSVDVSERTLREVHLPPFKACIDAGAPTVMSAFSCVNGQPVTGSHLLLTEILRGEWKFPGFVVSDAKAVDQLVQHGLAEDNRAAARAALTAGLDVELIGTCYQAHLESLVNDGVVPMQTLDEAVRRVLWVKWKLGLFERPVVPSQGPDAIELTQAKLDLAREAARQSLVLLKNEKQTLPLAKEVASIAVIGPLADAAKDQLGTWTVYGKPEDTRTPLRALRETLGEGKVRYAPGLPAVDSRDTSQIKAAVEAAKNASIAILFLGEPSSYTGEAHNRAYLTLPGAQSALLTAVHDTGTPVVLVLMTGRPLELGTALNQVSSLLLAWHPGTMGGPAIADVLLGDVNPSGKLPVSWPRAVGQIPIHYNHLNTGRPNPLKFDPAINEETQLDTRHVTGYIDLPTVPQFPFGYGLSYTTFECNDLKVGPSVQPGEPIHVTANVRNAGSRKGDEIVQLYVRDLVASVPRPVRELKGFKRITLEPGESKTVEFTLTSAELAFYNREMKRVTEPGKFQVWIGGDSVGGALGEFEVR